MGETDALVEMNELAARDFIFRANESGDASAYIEEATKRLGVRVHLSEFNSFDQHRACNYIVITYQSGERFLQQFRREHVALYGDWKGDREGVDPFTLTLENMERVHEGWILDDFLKEAFDYYRLLRHWITHPKAKEPQPPKVDDETHDPEKGSLEKEFGPLKAPNPATQLSFDDFILFSRLLKRIAEKLSIAAMPPIDFLHEKFAKVNKFKRIQQNPTRQLNAITGLLSTEYGYDHATAQWLAEEIQGLLA